MPVCRNGRRGGLKIPCANNTCGFDPHHRHKKGNPPACLEGFLFYLRRVSGSNSTALLSRVSDQPCGLSLSARETPTTGSSSLSGGVFFFICGVRAGRTARPCLQGERSALRAVAQCAGDPHLPDHMIYRSGNGAVHFLCGSFCLLSAAPPARAGSSVPPYSPPAKGRFCPPHLWPGVPREWPSVLPKGRTLPGKKRRKAAPAIYSAVSYRFYNVFCKKGFTNEFQKHII